MGNFFMKESFQNEYQIYSLRENFGFWSWSADYWWDCFHWK